MCGNEPGSKETYAEQVCMPLGGKVRCIDRCIHHMVAALNEVVRQYMDPAWAEAIDAPAEASRE